MSRLFLALSASVCFFACGSSTPPVPNTRHPLRPPEPTEARAPYTATDLANVVGIAEIAMSPDGAELAFTSDRTGAYELFTVSLVDANAAPVQRTNAHEYVSGLRYSHDSSMLVYQMDHGGDERTELYMFKRGTPDAIRLTETGTAENSARFSPDDKRLAFLYDPDRPFRSDVAVMDLATKSVTRLTHNEINVSALSWNADGKTIVATRTPDDNKGELLVVDVRTKRVRVLAPPRADGIAYPIEPTSDGKLLAQATNADGFSQLASIDPKRMHVDFVGPAQWDVVATALDQAGHLVVARNVHGETLVSISSPPYNEGETISEQGWTRSLAMDDQGKMLAAIREDSSSPASIAVYNTTQRTWRTVVAATVGSVDVSQLARAERREIQSFDEHSIDVFVWKPPVSRLGSPPPAIAYIHGGPSGQIRASFTPQIQALVEAGFVVIAPNYRGSVGYGRAFEDLNNGDWGRR